MKKVALGEKILLWCIIELNIGKGKFMLDVAEKFFWPCDEGKGWEACKEYCHTNATFKTDADTLILTSIGSRIMSNGWKMLIPC